MSQEFSPPPLNQHSVVNVLGSYMRTGNIFLDMLLASFLSSIIGLIFSVMQGANVRGMFTTAYTRIKKWFFPQPPVQEQKKLNTLEIPVNRMYYETGGGTLYNMKSETFDDGNEKIHEAIYNFLYSFQVNNTSSELGLTFTEGTTIADTIRNSKFKIRPKDTVVYDGFYIEFETGDTEIPGDPSAKGNKRSINQRRMLKIKSYKSMEEIKEFVHKIYQEWVEKNYPKENNSLKRYYMVCKNPSKLEFQAMPMTTDVTFDDIFFPKKQLLVQRINDFMAGKIKIPKFTVLLHGKPGGGKTSFIKALYNLTKCHVININLNDFRNFDDLFRVFHEESVRLCEDTTETAYGKIKIPINQRIYLIEDIDAQDNIVHQRKGEEKEKIVKPKDDKSKEDKSKDNKDKSKEVKDQKKVEKDKKREEKKQKKKEEQNKRAEGKKKKEEEDQESDEDNNGDGECDEGEECEDKDKNKAKPNGSQLDDSEPDSDSDSDSDSSDSEDDFNFTDWTARTKPEPSPTGNLTLSKILNLLDGVKELNKCFIVMTTNHYNKLDSALVRPGRITWKQELKPIRTKDMKRVIHKFLRDKYDPEQCHPDLDPMLDKLAEINCMPGLFESFCIHEYCLEDIITNIKSHLDEIKVKQMEYIEYVKQRKAKREKREKKQMKELEKILKIKGKMHAADSRVGIPYNNYPFS